MPPADFKVLISRQKETVTVTLVGELRIDFEDADSYIKSVLVHKPRKIVVDAAQLTFMTSVGLCFLMNLRRAMNEIGGTLTLLHLQPRIRKVLEQARILQFFTVSPGKAPG